MAFGEAMRARRKAAGLSLRALAREAHVDPGHLSRIEAGTRPPTTAIAEAVDVALDAGGALVAAAGRRPAARWRIGDDSWRHEDAEALALALVEQTPTPDNALRMAHEWLIAEPPQVYEVRAGRRIGAPTVEHVEQRVHQLRLLDDHVGGEETFALVTGEVTATADLLQSGSYAEDVGRRLLIALGELCQVAGWVASDAGRHSDAERLYLNGLRAAHAGGDRAGAANNLSSLSYQMANVGDPRDAVVLARSASCDAKHHTSATTRALLLERVAWAHARAGDAHACDRTLAAVERELEHQRPDGDPVWVYWLSAEEVEIMAGRCWTELRRPLRAVPILERATAGYGADIARETTLYLTWLAEAFVQAHEVDQAASAATRALRLARVARSDRATERVEVLRRVLEPHRGNVVVDEFEDVYRSTS
ncbi:helix-turn-helix domain-containing protein [Dactylosporangium sp. NPDC000521]|uniref:helix-turn-helix domain-containing protein n=1 Tax=Dactylosporangium sp. NPDC000521 TaxID=3363975 RepID=UPI0036C94D31